MRTRIKICGVTRPEDAAAAVRAGADAIGVVFAPSPRRLTLDQAELVMVEVPPPVARIGVFVDADQGFVAQAVERLDLSAVQYHGDESPEACAAAPAPVIKAFGIDPEVGIGFALDRAEPYRSAVAAVLLDTHSHATRGGSGKTSFHVLTCVPEWAPVLIAGGLDHGNVGEAVCILTPFCVDVSSGVESSPGIKDHTKIEAFVAAVRAADEEVYR